MNPDARKYLAAIGRRGGKAKSRAKSAAAKANGALGGRPKKPKRAAQLPNAESRDGGLKASD